jgi:hypothetical protein
MKMISSLSLNVGRKTVSPYFRMNRWNTFKISDNPAFLIAGLQVCKNVGKRHGLLSKYLAFFID